MGYEEEEPSKKLTLAWHVQQALLEEFWLEYAQEEMKKMLADNDVALST